MKTFRRLDRAVVALRLCASSEPPYDGHPASPTIERCRAVLVDASLTRDFAVLLIFSRDTGYHTSGWLKNPDYERCYHLSISFYDCETMDPAEQQPKLAEKIASAFYGHDTRKIWIEPPYSPEGHKRDVHHYRLFCDAGWQPIQPRGEVYSRELTEAGWKSWSDLHDGARCEHHRQANEP